ncbi:TonB-dependent receptor [Dokdonia sp. Dokd-P16]|uniref:TonB-dependent receptor plug domain-containing protein n=1 Tax=Dokdonia sp. Dokd-P16 TaxID=2173169 RepID=UPI000D549BAC|nr:TonB-dependent receptor [Dokdonia sp. Dokd-P16]AWH75467.1 TonB-dependent receptor [Dokdonia sp. Dokd-P16]
MIKKVFSILFPIIFFLFFSDVRSQENNSERIPLVAVLKSIETRYDVRFSYVDELVSSIKIPRISNDKTLDEALLFITNYTGYDFDKLNNRFIVLRDLNRPSEIQELDNIYIASLLTSGISKSSSGVTIIAPKQFGILPGVIEPDVLQTVQALPGIISTDETVSDLNIRGGTNDQNLILWDGIKMYQSGHFFGLISAFNPYLTKRVEVIKNGTSARYGDGVSGVLKIGLEDSLSNEKSGSISANLLHVKGFARLPLTKKSTLLLSARRSHTDITETPTYSNYTNRIFQDTDLEMSENLPVSASNINFFFYDISAKYIYNISDRDYLSVSATTLFNKLEYNENTTAAGVFARSGINQGNRGLKIKYARQWNPQFKTDLNLYASNYNLKSRNFNIENNQQLDQENEVLDLGFTLNTHLKLSDNFRWENGYQFTEIGTRNLAQTNNPIFFRNEKNVTRTQALFTELSFLSSNNTTQFTVGSRASYLKRFNKLIVEPRLRFSQRFLNYFKISALGEFKNQSIFQIIDQPNDFLGLERRRWVAANEDNLPILRSKQASVSLDYTRNKWLFSVEGYVKEVAGISSRSQGFQNQFQFTNATGSYDVTGLDFLTSKRFKSFTSWLSYSYSKNNYTFDALNESRRFPNNKDIRHSVSAGTSYSLERFKLSLGFNWRSGTPFTRPQNQSILQNNQIVYERPNSSLSDSFLRFDISTIYNFKILKNDAQIGASIWNLFNNNNILNTYYLVDSENEVQQMTVKSLGFTPNLSFQYNF